jgi:hypothetical protein
MDLFCIMSQANLKKRKKMKARAWFGPLIWIIGFNLFVAGVAYFWSASWAVLLLLIGHVSMGFPNLYNKWRAFIFGKEAYSHIPPIAKRWPGKIWILVTAIGILITIVSFIWANQPLKTILAGI